MSHKESFGLRLRAARERRGMTLESIAAKTKVPAALWEALERNDFSTWPSGLFARAYVRDYAGIVGLDADEVVEEFCRFFPNGDRRRGRLIRAQAEIVDIRSQYRDEQLPAGGDRRAGGQATVAQFPRFASGQTGQRVLGALGDIVVVGVTTALISQLFGPSFLATLGVVSLTYYSVGVAIIGRSPGLALAHLLARRVPELVQVRQRRRMHAS
jgi:transcriptional regulator with XRE-family HTH domain